MKKKKRFDDKQIEHIQFINSMLHFRDHKDDVSGPFFCYWSFERIFENFQTLTSWKIEVWKGIED
jgi:hypothetical protein